MCIYTIHRIVMKIQGAQNSLYAGEEFLLQFRFPDSYPMESPEVMFIGSTVPMHPHIYSNGHLCLNILDTDWSPVLGIESVCLSIQSMLSSCQKKEKPRDDDMYVRNSLGRSPKQVCISPDSILFMVRKSDAGQSIQMAFILIPPTQPTTGTMVLPRRYSVTEIYTTVRIPSSTSSVFSVCPLSRDS